MQYRRLGKTGLMVSEIGLGGEWLERHTTAECGAIIDTCEKLGVNILDCWMPGPKVRSDIGDALIGHREKWYIQGHIGSCWVDEQYVRNRELPVVKAAFQDLLDRFHTDYIDLGMIHYVDEEKDWENIHQNGFVDYVRQLKKEGVIRHIGLSTHNPYIGIKAVESGLVELLMFSINPAFDIMPPSENLDDLFAEDYSVAGDNIDPARARLYKLCEQKDVGITVMKPFAGGRLLDGAASPFGVALTPVQCLHYALTRPGVASIMCGVNTPEQMLESAGYEDATDAEKDYASVLAAAPMHAHSGQCTYCGHCRPCPMHIDIAMVNKFADLAEMQPEVPESVRSHYMLLEKHAGDCVGCRGCETRCPFGVKIAERMEKTAALFGC